MHDLCISGGQFECEKVAGVRRTGLLTSSIPDAPVRSSSGCKGNGGPCIKQLPPNLAPSVRLKEVNEITSKKIRVLAINQE